MSASGMLVRFSVGNFRSFDNIQTFSLIAGNAKNHSERLYSAPDFKLLKFAAIFGANASGKSNLIKAVRYASLIVIGGMESDSAARSRTCYYRLDHQNKDKNSYFEFEILIDDVVYAYGFEISLFNRKIKEEWLIRLEKTGDMPIYTRNTEGTSYFNESYLNSDNADRMRVYLEDYNHVTNKLFLTEIVSNKNDLYKNNDSLSVLKNVYNWIASLNVLSPDMPLSGYALSADDFSELLNALKSFDIGISNIVYKEISKEQALAKTDSDFKLLINNEIDKLRKLDLKNKKVLKINIAGRFILLCLEDDEPHFREVRFEHFNVSDVTFSLGEESAGTRRLLDLLSVFFARDGGVFIADELDRCLHPQVTLHFVKKYLQIAGKRNIQLIITTHESRLLNLNLLRNDEIYFMDRNKTGFSAIVLFDDYSERFGNKIDAAYLDGRYGAVPLL
ncbi:MAG: AAA family ATPase [Succinimonas sp.]|nr:AAA family ATPase [Succinimonas sp.]